MSVLLLLMGRALASGLPPWPQAGDTVPGECASTLGVTQGSLINPLLVNDGGLARCSFIAEPLSSYAHLLTIENHARQVRSLYELDVSALKTERDFWREQAEHNRPWHSQPWFIAVTMSALVTGSIVAYDWGTGGS